MDIFFVENAIIKLRGKEGNVDIRAINICSSDCSIEIIWEDGSEELNVFKCYK